jgi:hypothetical protein
MFLSSGIIGFLRSGQIWTVAADGASDPVQLSTFPIDVSNLKIHQGSQQVAFTALVGSDGELKKKPSDNFDSGVVYDGLFVRHWDEMVDSSLKSQLFIMKYSIKTTTVTIEEIKSPLKGIRKV